MPHYLKCIWHLWLLFWVCTVCQYPSTKPSPGFRIEFGSETTGCGLHIVNIWLVSLTHSLISLVDDNHMDSKLKEILVSIYSVMIINNQPKNDFGLLRPLG